MARRLRLPAHAPSPRATVDDERTIEQIVAALEAYLASRPLAADTMHGIIRWWLAALCVPPPDSALAAALVRVEARGRLRRRRMPDGTELWCGTGPHP